MKILVVDDDEMPRKMLSLSLKRLGYDVVVAASGAAALVSIAEDNVGVVIADWMMPEMDGIELCRCIRMSSKINHIYIILLTAKQDRKSKLAGFDAGIDEYLHKPYDIDELDAHIKVGVRIVNLERGLIAEHEKVNRYAHEMEELAAERARQLTHADRMATLGTLSAGVAHEINNPTTFISGNAQALSDFWPIIDSALSACPENNPVHSRVQFVRTEMPGVVEGIRSGAQRISRIVNGLKSFARQSTGRLIRVDVHQKIDDALALCNNVLKYNVVVSTDYSAEDHFVAADPQLLEQVFVNLFTNAADAMADAPGFLTISTGNSQNSLFVSIADSGTGIPDNIIKKIFNPFFTTKPVGKGTGLGLSITLGIIEEMSGHLIVENGEKVGAIFKIDLPIVK